MLCNRAKLKAWRQVAQKAKLIWRGGKFHEAFQLRSGKFQRNPSIKSREIYDWFRFKTRWITAYRGIKNWTYETIARYMLAYFMLENIVSHGHVEHEIRISILQYRCSLLYSYRCVVSVEVRRSLDMPDVLGSRGTENNDFIWRLWSFWHCNWIIVQCHISVCRKLFTGKIKYMLPLFVYFIVFVRHTGFFWFLFKFLRKVWMKNMRHFKTCHYQSHNSSVPIIPRVYIKNLSRVLRLFQSVYSQIQLYNRFSHALIR